MKPLLIETSLPKLSYDHTVDRARIYTTGTLPSLEAMEPRRAIEVQALYVLFLVNEGRESEAPAMIDTLVFNEQWAPQLPPLLAAWLWIARMTLFIKGGDNMLALGAAENALQALVTIEGKKRDDFLAVLASLLYNLASVHNALGDSMRATKELTQAQKLFTRLVKKDENRFSPMLLYAIEASTTIITNRDKQLEVLAQYQATTEQCMKQLEDAPGEQTLDALSALVDSLKNEGDLSLEMGNQRNAVKYYSRALRYQKKVSNTMGYKELTISIGLAKALNRIINRREAAEQLLNSLLPLAHKLNASNEVIEIENLLNNRGRNGNIMNMLKGLFN